MSIDIVFPYQLINNGYELKYALRSVAKHLSGVGEVFIVGDLPDWCKNVIHIPLEQTRGNIKWKERNIFEKVLAACNNDRVSDSFLFMNDDHFLLSDYEAAEFPNYYYGYLCLDEMAAYGDYKKTLWNTNEVVEVYSHNYDIHAPMVFTKNDFRVLKNEDWSKPFGYALKSMYANLFCADEGEEYEDLKIRRSAITYTEITELIKGRLWFSIGDRALNPDMKKVLNELYPNPSCWE